MSVPCIPTVLQLAGLLACTSPAPDDTEPPSIVEDSADTQSIDTATVSEESSCRACHRDADMLKEHAPEDTDAGEIEGEGEG